MSKPLLEALITSQQTDQAVALVRVIKAEGAYASRLGERGLVWADKNLSLDWLEESVWVDIRHCLIEHRSRLLNYKSEIGTIELFVEIQRQPPTLLIVGAGHIALPLARLGKMIDFKVVVLDDRARYANKERFPMADQVLAQPFQETLRDWPVDQDTYVVLITRGHQHDVESLLELLDSPARYIGMIGSKRRVRAVFDLLSSEKGIERAKFDRVYAPIGLDIGAETPAEIAICIIAEIIKIYRGGDAASLSETLKTDSVPHPES